MTNDDRRRVMVVWTGRDRVEKNTWRAESEDREIEREREKKKRKKKRAPQTSKRNFQGDVASFQWTVSARLPLLVPRSPLSQPTVVVRTAPERVRQTRRFEAQGTSAAGFGEMCRWWGLAVCEVLGESDIWVEGGRNCFFFFFSIYFSIYIFFRKIERGGLADWLACCFIPIFFSWEKKAKKTGTSDAFLAVDGQKKKTRL